MSGEIQSGMSSVGGNVPILGDGWVQLGGPTSTKQNWDELSRAEQVVVLQFLLNSQFPILTPPAAVSGSSSPTEKIAVGDVSTRAKQALLDSWLDQVKKEYEDWQAREERDRIKSAARQHQIDGLASMQALYNQSPEFSERSDFSVLTLGIVITGMGITEAMMVDPGTQVGINPIQDMADKTIAQLAPDLTMVIPVFALGIQYATTFETVGKAVKGEPTRDLDYAKKYAENMRELVRNPVFTNYLSALITANVAKGAPVPKDRMDHLLAFLKVILLSLAMASVYKAETGGYMSSKEFQDMLNKGIEFPEGDIRFELADMIQEQLKLLSDPEKAKLLTAINSFFNSNPSVKLLTNPSKAFANFNQHLLSNGNDRV